MAEGPSSYAQSGTTTVNIKLDPMRAIVVNNAVVNLEYKTLENYNNGVETPMTNHLTVYSVGGFIVNVISEGDFKNGSNSIPAGDVIITATSAEGSPGVFSPVTLSTPTSETPLITSADGGFNMNYDVKYSTMNSKGNAFLYAKHLGGTYTAVVTYQITSN